MWAVRPVIAPQGMPGRGEALSPVAGELEDRHHPAVEHVRVGVEGLDPPDRPAVAIVAERLVGDGDRLGPVGRPRGQGEHQDLGPRAEEGAGVPLADLVDVGLVAVVAGDGDPLAVVGGRPDLGEVVVAAELAVGVAGDPAHQEQVALDLAGVPALVEEVAGLAPRPLEERQADDLPGQIEHRASPILRVARAVGRPVPPARLASGRTHGARI